MAVCRNWRDEAVSKTDWRKPTEGSNPSTATIRRKQQSYFENNLYVIGSSPIGEHRSTQFKRKEQKTMKSRLAFYLHGDVCIIRKDILEKRNDICRWIEEKRSKAYMCRELDCKPETLNSYLVKMGITYKGQQALKGVSKNFNSYKPALYYTESNIPISSHKLKAKLVKDGQKKNQCEICGVSTWQGKRLPLELHHIDGNHHNNSLLNLCIQCPNCHAVQPGNAGANMRK